MDYFTKDDLAQIDRTYLQNLEKETVIDVDGYAAANIIIAVLAILVFGTMPLRGPLK